MSDENKTKDDVVEEIDEEVEETCIEEDSEVFEEVEVIEEIPDIVDEAEAKYNEVADKLADMQDKFQRTLAEFDNFRKRTMKEKASMYNDGVKDTIEKLLPIFDNLERAIQTVQTDQEDDPLLKGVRMTDKQLKETLIALGVEEINALGEKFDPNLHAAVAHVEDENYGENEVILDMLKGYKYKDKVIRHSMVKVAN